MGNWIGSVILSLIFSYFYHWSSYQFFVMTALFAIFLNTCRNKND